MKRHLLLVILLTASCHRQPLTVTRSKGVLLANGYDHMTFGIEGASQQPKIEILGDSHFVRLHRPRFNKDHWEAELSASVMPGVVRVRITDGKRHVKEAITLQTQTSDSASDGTPDFLRLEDESDREAFRYWLTYLAELQYFIASGERTREIIDCSSLVRFVYHEALRDHDAAWLAGFKLPMVQAHSSVSKYSFPHTLLGPRLFRTRGGSYSPDDLNNGAFAEFADAKTLQSFNTFFVTRDIARAQPGDLLFYRRDTTKGVSYHSMIFLGQSPIKPDGEIYVVYHTGPDGSNDGEIRRLTATQLLHFPNPEWQPIAANRLFLGVYRWNILKVIS